MKSGQSSLLVNLNAFLFNHHKSSVDPFNFIDELLGGSVFCPHPEIPSGMWVSDDHTPFPRSRSIDLGLVDGWAYRNEEIGALFV